VFAVIANIVVRVLRIFVKILWFGSIEMVLGTPAGTLTNIAQLRNAFLLATMALSFANATTVIVIRDGGRIVLGTESFRSDPGHDSIHCKLEHVNGVFFAMHGTVVAAKQLRFDARDIAREVMRRVDSVESRYDAFRDRIVRGLQEFVDGEREHHSPLYESFSRGLDYPLGTIFAAPENGNAVLIITQFVVNPQGRVIPKPVQTSPQRLMYRGGFAESVKPETIQEMLRTLPPEIVTERVISTVISNFPNENSYPIAIVQITGKGYKWVKRPPTCQE
jgi:hypothetical protein